MLTRLGLVAVQASLGDPRELAQQFDLLRQGGNVQRPHLSLEMVPFEIVRRIESQQAPAR